MYVMDWEGKYFNLDRTVWVYLREGLYESKPMTVAVFAEIDVMTSHSNMVTAGAGTRATVFLGCVQDIKMAKMMLREWILNEEDPMVLISLQEVVNNYLRDYGPQDVGSVDGSRERHIWLEQQIQQKFRWGDVIRKNAQG